jgi:hypothetical protein
VLSFDAAKSTQILRHSATLRRLCRRDPGVSDYGGDGFEAHFGAQMEKIVLLCLLIGIIGVLAEFARTAQPRQ